MVPPFAQGGSSENNVGDRVRTFRCLHPLSVGSSGDRSGFKIYEQDLSPEEPTLKGCKQRKVLTLSPTLFSDDAPWTKGGTILFLSSIVPIRTSGLVRFVLLSTQFSVFIRDHVGER
ncbi:hypothetical protein L6452_36731 [Arctium lappa]|uniref:Uncharacterized protein n=1 Tax=Arctium lappa TaxID=4217 RepID=A0ACB8Y0X1_ARCLA|nr:hypothetical protein L6452_36731 [Arctium lappa]